MNILCNKHLIRPLLTAHTCKDDQIKILFHRLFAKRHDESKGFLTWVAKNLLFAPISLMKILFLKKKNIFCFSLEISKMNGFSSRLLRGAKKGSSMEKIILEAFKDLNIDAMKLCVMNSIPSTKNYCFT